MTIPKIDGAMVERAFMEAKKHDSVYSDSDARACLRKVLEAALERRVGEKDRRKVWDEVASKDRRRSTSCLGRIGDPHGRRSTDKTDWLKLPRAKPTTPPIHVSDGMIEVGQKAFCDADLLCIVSSVYTAMEAKRREEAG